MHPAKSTSYGCDKIHDNGVVSLAQNCSELQVLSLWGCCEITDASVVELGKHCAGLQKLYLRGCSSVTAAAIHDLQQAAECGKLAGVRGPAAAAGSCDPASAVACATAAFGSRL